MKRTPTPRWLLIAALALSPALALRAAAPTGTPTGSAAGSQTVNWNLLKTLKTDAHSTPVPSPALQLNGKRVSIPGFMVPLEDDADTVSEFLLVPYAGACIHVPPPPPNQMVHVLIHHNGKVPVSFTDPILVTGTLRVATVDSPYGNVSYDMAADSVTPYTGG